MVPRRRWDWARLDVHDRIWLHGVGIDDVGRGLAYDACRSLDFLRVSARSRVPRAYRRCLNNCQLYRPILPLISDSLNRPRNGLRDLGRIKHQGSSTWKHELARWMFSLEVAARLITKAVFQIPIHVCHVLLWCASTASLSHNAADVVAMVFGTPNLRTPQSCFFNLCREVCMFTPPANNIEKPTS